MEKATQINVDEKEKKFNRQINFFLMRYMWNLVRKRKSRGGLNIYDALGITRERYTRVIEYGTIRYKRRNGKEEKYLQDITGISEQIFTGEKCFCCTYKKDSQELVISKEEWQTFFDSRITNEDGMRGKDNTFLDKLEKVYQYNKSNLDNEDIYNLFCYLKYLKPLRTINEINSNIKQLDFAFIDGCETEVLKELLKTMKEKVEMITTVINYRSY